MNKNVIIIMAGGLGKRMNSNLPKVLHKINHKPMLVHIVEQSLLIEPIQILIVVGNYKDLIEKTLSEYIDLNNIHIDVQFILQKEPLGTGHAIQCCYDELTKHNNINDTNVIILSGDVPFLKSTTINDMLCDFNNIKIVTTIMNNPYGYGRIIEKEGLFEKILEEKDCSLEEKEIKKVNCGIYIINSAVLCKYLPLLQNTNAQNEYYLTDIIELIKNGEQLSVGLYNVPEERQIEIIGINTNEQLQDLEKLVTNNDE